MPVKKKSTTKKTVKKKVAKKTIAKKKEGYGNYIKSTSSFIILPKKNMK